MFITDEDYDVQAQADVLKLLDGSDDKHRLRQAEKYAIGEINKRLAGRYDMASVFNKTDDDRDAYIVMITIDIAIYHLYAQKSPRQIPEYRQIRYDNALEWLRDVGNGTNPTDLPPVPDEDYRGPFKIWSLYKPNDNKY
ncbi:phage protein Gp36 family protein [Dysgonomonas termitidis]|uniref:Phage protein Gp36 family protein n=1 Tax=Dysgonomonas termitidis TaxID=1516126 RepID=A0ABV9KUE8_9BACT